MPAALKTALLVLLGVVALTAAGIHFYLQATLGDMIERHVGERLGTRTHVGSVGLQLFPRGLTLSGLNIENAKGFDEDWFLRIREVRLTVADYEPARRLVESPQLVIDGMRVDLERQGSRSNSNTILEHMRRIERRQGITRQDKTKLLIRDLRIRNLVAKIRFGRASTKVRIPELRLRNVGARTGGVTIGELADIITRAAVRAALNNEKGQADERKIGEELREKAARKLERLLD